MIKEIEKQIVQMILADYRNIIFEKLEYERKYHDGGTNIYVHQNGIRKIDFTSRVVFNVIDLTDNILKLSDSDKFNELIIFIYPDESYESKFVWNEDAYQYGIKMSFFITLDWLYNRLQEYITSSDLMNPTFLLHPDGSISGDYSNIIESGYFIIERKNNFFYISGEAKSQKGEVFPFQYEPAGTRNQTYVPSAYVQEQLQNIYTLTLPNGELSEVYPMWNKITIPIISSQLNFEDLETFKFEWREDLA